MNFYTLWGVKLKAKLIAQGRNTTVKICQKNVLQMWSRMTFPSSVPWKQTRLG